MEELTKNLHLRCRLCLMITDEMIPLFEPNTEGVSIANILLNIALIQIKNEDMLPKFICCSCKNTINSFYSLIRTYRENEEYLENTSIKIELETEKVINENKEYLSDDDKCNISDENSVNDEEVVSEKYECQDCGDFFLLKSNFISHVRKHHNKLHGIELDPHKTPITVTVSKQAEDAIGESNSTKSRYWKRKGYVRSKHECQICRKPFENGPSLKEHYNIHKTHKCETCGAAFMKKSYLRDHQMTHTSEKRYMCKDCGKGFKYRNGLAVHRTVHDNYRGIICDMCGAGFNARATLKMHIKLKHVGGQTFPCSQCNQSFKVKSWLDKHFLRKHTNNRQKDFVCSICGIAYLNKTTLTRHVSNKHTGTAVRHQCPICDKSYTMKNKLNKHIQNKHNTILTS